MVKGVFLCFVFTVATCVRVDDYITPVWNPQPDICEVGPKGRVPWIIHVRDSDYGWKEHTHRANIALAVYGYQGTDDEMRKMGLQLEVEITRALFRNSTSPIHESDLALYIHALLATNKNPRNFHGTDLVADLLHRVDNARGKNVHPFLVLALCNAHAVTFDHLLKIKSFLQHDHGDDRLDVDSREAQMKAIAFKAFACAASVDPYLDKFSTEMKRAAECLRNKHNMTDGTFGNVYTTSLAVQAFTVSKGRLQWNEQKALDYLLKESEIEVNLIKAYYIEMALNARKVKFIKDLYTGSYEGVSDPQSNMHSVRYTVRKGRTTDVDFSVTIKVPVDMNFYEIMQKTAELSDRFEFSYYKDVGGLPMVYAVAGLPNDAEENMFWRICRKFDVDPNRHVSNVTFNDSPAKLKPESNEHIIFWYLNTECP